MWFGFWLLFLFNFYMAQHVYDTYDYQSVITSSFKITSNYLLFARLKQQKAD